MMEKFDIAVIGGGPAGITLAKMLGGRSRVAVIRPEDHSMIYCAMPYAIEGLIEEGKTLKKDSLVTDAGAELIRTSVTGVDFNGKVVTLSDSSQITYDKLVIATGATPFIPPIPGNDLNGVTGFKTRADLNSIVDPENGTVC
jgi:NADPH-dependent 2,4-dienoyl-CoA reductase/sulfur reductase-like enzyme